MATNAMQLKIAPFWRKDPELWFVQLEKLFTIHRITTDNTKFNHVVSVLDTYVLASVRKIVLTPPENDKYNAIKNAIIAAFTDSPQSRLSQLLTGTELGEQKPSQLLSQMVQMGAGILEDENAIRALWTQKLHPTVRALMSAFPRDASIESLGRQADMTYEAIQGSVVNAVDTSSQQKPDAVLELSRQVEALATEVHQMRSKNDSRKRSPPRRSSGLCWFHEKFGSQAKYEPMFKVMHDQSQMSSEN